MKNIQQVMAERTLGQSEEKFALNVNGLKRKVTATADTPLLFVLREQLHLKGPRFGCGLAQCGTCTVHLDGKPIRSCVTPVVAGAGKEIVTLEGLAAAYHNVNTKPSADSEPTVAVAPTLKLHPVQEAWIEAQVPQCGYCQNGWIMYSAALLGQRPQPSMVQMKRSLSGLKCRCATHAQILEAISLAAKKMA
jgi:aerobic-type carbon monoxide dehydrogenase small subunit (CoxS/CutS family)